MFLVVMISFATCLFLEGPSVLFCGQKRRKTSVVYLDAPAAPKLYWTFFVPPRNQKPCHSLGSNSKKKKKKNFEKRCNGRRPLNSETPKPPKTIKTWPQTLRLFCPRKVKLSKNQRTRKAKVNDIGTLLNIGLVYRCILIHALYRHHVYNIDTS